MVQVAVASNPNTPMVILEGMAGTEDKEIRGGIARNPNAPAVILERLAKDKSPWVQRVAIYNFSAPVAAVR